MVPGVPRVRGLSLESWLDAFTRLYGDGAAVEVLKRLPPEAALKLRTGLQSSEWYPVAWFRALCSAGREVTRGGLDVIARVARVAAAAEFSGVNRVLVLFLSPQRLLRASGRVFERYYSEGQVSCLARGKTGAEVRWSGCVGFDENLWHDCWTATVVLIEMCGGRNVVFESIHGGKNGDPHATVVFYWQ